MTIQTAIATQQRRLLRLLAGWLALVTVVRAVPLGAFWMRVFCRVMDSLVSGAETAVEKFLVAQAHIIAKAEGSAADPGAPQGLTPYECSAALSLPALRRRIMCLQRRLSTLPRGARRLLRRAMREDATLSVPERMELSARSALALFAPEALSGRAVLPLIADRGGSGRAPPQAIALRN